MAVGTVIIQGPAIISPDANYQGFIRYPNGEVAASNRRTQDKWSAVQAWFPQFVRDRSFLDIGCATGFFVFKAQPLASSAAGCDIDFEAIASLQNCTEGMNLSFFHADFPSQVPCSAQAVLAMSILHHLARKHAFARIAEGLARATLEEAVVEFIDRDDNQVKCTELSTRDDYCKEAFWLALEPYFEGCEQIGHGHHPTRMLYRIKRKKNDCANLCNYAGAMRNTLAGLDVARSAKSGKDHYCL